MLIVSATRPNAEEVSNFTCASQQSRIAWRSAFSEWSQTNLVSAPTDTTLERQTCRGSAGFAHAAEYLGVNTSINERHRMRRGSIRGTGTIDRDETLHECLIFASMERRRSASAAGARETRLPSATKHNAGLKSSSRAKFTRSGLPPLQSRCQLSAEIPCASDRTKGYGFSLKGSPRHRDQFC